jgi:hypothetical protein
MRSRMFAAIAVLVGVLALWLLIVPAMRGRQLSASPLADAAPTLTAMSPDQAYNYQPTTVTITGTSFALTPTVQLNNVLLPDVSFVSSTTLTATVLAELPGGVYTLTVTNPDSQTVSLADAFTVLLSGDGSLGTWQFTSSLNGIRHHHAAVAVGNYIYAVGGSNSPSGFLGSPLNTVERAAVNSDGSLGAWQVLTATMNTSREGLAAVVVNGYLYAIGGYDMNSVERAAINPDGTLGPWQMISSLTTSRWGLTAVEANGYIYAIGGFSLSSVERAAINSDGSLGTWQVISSMLTPCFHNGAVAAGGYIYVSGQRAAINADGSLGPWQWTSWTLEPPASGAGVVAVQGYLYVVGCQCDSVTCWEHTGRTVINPDGSFGPWQIMMSGMSAGRTLFAVVEAGGYLYAIGGYASDPYGASYGLSNVERAATSPFSLIALSPSAALTDRPTIITADGTNFLPAPTLRLGETITLSTGFISTTTLTVTIPAGLASGWYTATLVDPTDRVAALSNALAVYVPLPTPTLAGSSPAQAYSFQATPITITGSNFLATSTVRLGHVKLTGLRFVNSTTLTATVPAGMSGGSYTLTVTNPDSQSTTLPNAFTVLHSGNGNLGQWQTMTSMTVPRWGCAAVAANGYIYAIGGWDSGSLDSVERAAINPDSSLGPWQVLSSTMTIPRDGHAAIAAGGYVYALGGCSQNSCLSSVERAAINPDGSLGVWQGVSAMLTPRFQFAAVAVDGYVYAIGGRNEQDLPFSSVERAVINPDGTLGPWEIRGFSLTTPRFAHGAVVVDGAIYVIGGISHNGSDFNLLSSVERAVINADGSVGPWQIMTAMISPRYLVAAVTADGYLYVMSGDNNNVERATVIPEDSLGPWEVISPTLTIPRESPIAVVAGGYVYAISGDSSGSSVERAAISPPMPVSLSPSLIPADRATTIIVSGTNFLPAPSLRLGDVTTVTANFISTSTLTATIPAGLSSGWYTVTLTDMHGRVADLTNAFLVDATAPTGTLAVNGGASATNDQNVQLNLSASDVGSGVAEMSFSNDGTTWGSWQGYAVTATWTLTNGEGIKTVYARFKDGAGNISAPASDAITLDTVAPTGSIVVADDAPFVGTTIVSLTLNAVDTTSGVAQTSFSNDGSGWSAWQTYAISTTWTLTSGDGNKTVYACFKDNAGNISATASDTVTLDTTAPAGSVVVAGGATYVATTTVSLTLDAIDSASGVAQMSFSDDGSNWSAWETYATSKTWTLTSGDGSKVVYARYRDAVGNASVAYNDTITLDTTAPTGSIVIENGAAAATDPQVVLTLAASDTNGVTYMRLRNDTGTWSAWEPFATSRSWMLPITAGEHTVWVQFHDPAGNESVSYSDSIVYLPYHVYLPVVIRIP